MRIYRTRLLFPNCIFGKILGLGSLLFPFLFASLASALPLAKKVLAMKEKANTYYRQKKYVQACDIYKEITLLDTLDARTRIDLGLCLQNLGEKDSALQVSRQALSIAGRSLGSASDSLWSNVDLRTRKGAYYNLDKLGGPMREPDSGHCESWASLGTCAQRFFVCADIGRQRTKEGFLHWSILRVALTKERAIFSTEESETLADLPRPDMLDMETQNTDGEFESRIKWLNRDSVVTLPLGETLVRDSASCPAPCKVPERILSECRVLHFDPCTGVIGVACGLNLDEKDDQIVIGEYYLIPARP